MSERNYAFDAPILFRRRRKKKKKGSAARRDARQTERYLLKAVQRSIRAADEGMATYRRERKKSRRKSGDDVIVSLLPNVVKGSSRTLRVLSLVPYDLMRAAYTRSGKKAVRATFRSAARFSDDMLL